MRTWSPLSSRVAPKVAAGQPSRSAIMLGTTPIDPSVDDMPQITRSGSAFWMAAARMVLVPNASDP